MKNPIQITRQNKDLEETVDARELHELLGSKQDFTHWIKNRLIDSPYFEENVDYAVSHKPVNKTHGGQNKKDYAMTIKTALLTARKERTESSLNIESFLLEQMNKDFVVQRFERQEFLFGKEIVENLFSDYTIIPQFPVLKGKYNIDWYIPELKIAIEFDETHHTQIKEKDNARQIEIEAVLGCRFIRYTQQENKETYIKAKVKKLSGEIL